MKYIVFDLEFTVQRKQQWLSEIIEIGAIELQTDDTGQLAFVDLFHTHVQPSRNPILSKLTTDFTGITQEQINSAPGIDDAINLFREWLGEEPYYLFAWGPDDRQHFVSECRAHSIELNWLQNYNDLQLQFTRLQGKEYRQRLGLSKSLTLLDIPFFGKQHNALDDAYNTAKIFTKIFSQLTFEQNNAAEDYSYTTEIVFSTGHEENRPFGQLAALLRMAL